MNSTTLKIKMTDDIEKQIKKMTKTQEKIRKKQQIVTKQI